MASKNGNSGKGQYSRHSLTSRASSATLLLKNHFFNNNDGHTDEVDITIAAGLLGREPPHIPPRNSSVSPRRSVIENYNHNLRKERDSNLRQSRQNTTSNTWTSSTGHYSDDDSVEDRDLFVQEYNKIARKYGVAAIVPDDYEIVKTDKVTLVGKQGSWIMRKLLRRTSLIQATKSKSEKPLKHKRSISDLSMRLSARKDCLKDKNITELARLCGTSPLYMPAEYAAGTLSVPTCIRATGQHLLQHATTSRGIFRIPGALSRVTSLYNHYALQDEDTEVVSDTVRYPTLPEHLKYDTHDVASAFKKFISGLPGGLLGSLWLFDAFVSIHHRLDCSPEWIRTKQTKVRARLIAFAIASHPSRYQRDLICSVFGLLCMIGRASETAPREDIHGRPLPTSDLMGYRSLGVVFGPLLIGDLIDKYSLYTTQSNASRNSSQTTVSKSLKGRHKKTKSGEDSLIATQHATEKMKVANHVTEMLITHWRDVVRQMRSIGALRSISQLQGLPADPSLGILRPSVSYSFALHKPRDWDEGKEEEFRSRREADRSPTPSSGRAFKRSNSQILSPSLQDDHTLSVKKQRDRQNQGSRHNLLASKSIENISLNLQDRDTGEDGEYLENEIINLSSSHLTTQPLMTSERMIPLDASLREQGEGVHTGAALDPVTSILSLPNPEHTRIKDGEEYKVTRGMHSGGNTENIVAHNSTSTRVDEVPQGIVSQRIQGITATDPGVLPPGFQTLLRTGSPQRVQQKRMSEVTTVHSQRFGTDHRDPLARVSQEEDLTSLASLAEVIQSEPDDLNLSPNPPDLVETKRSSPETPKRPMIDLFARTKESRSVKTMVARIDKTEQSPNPTPSFDKLAKRTSTTTESSMQSQVISGYTTNESPAIRSHKSNQSNKSMQSPSGNISSKQKRIMSPARQRVRHADHHTKKLTGDSGRATTSEEPMDQNSNLLRTGDGTESHILHRNSDVETVGIAPLGSQEFMSPPSATALKTIDYFRPFHASTTDTDHETVFPSTMSSPIMFSSLSSKNLQLFSQIRNLQVQLQAKTREADELREQLDAGKKKLQDINSLMEEQTTLQKDLRMWQERAETAERILELLAEFSIKEKLDDEDKGQPLVTETTLGGRMQAGNDKQVVDKIMSLLYGLDGDVTDDSSIASEEMARRVSDVLGLLTKNDENENSEGVVESPGSLEGSLLQERGPYELL